MNALPDREILDNLLAGGVGGFVATAPMTAFMELARRYFLPCHQQYGLPPRQITMRVASWAGLKRHLAEPEKKAATFAAHFSYGAAAGAVYGPCCQYIGRPGVASGIVHGLAVWSGSYLGLLPALGILPPATRHPLRRNALMIAAHVVWGAALGGLTSCLTAKRHSFEGERKHATQQREETNQDSLTGGIGEEEGNGLGTQGH
jgi:hypothetical protein